MGGEGGTVRGRRARVPRVALACGIGLVALCAAGLAFGAAFGLRDRIASFGLMERNVSEKFVVYIEGLAPSGKLVLLEGRQRHVASREFTARILAILRIDARVELSALADTAYYVDLSDPSRWKASWSPRSRVLRIVAPAPGLLPPAVRTDSIEVRTTGGNLLSSAIFSLKREAEEMRSELSDDLLAEGRRSLESPELRSKIAARLEELARTFCASLLGAEPARVEVAFDDVG
jgi:hypothetical protein